jgi:hypothetical protein
VEYARGVGRACTRGSVASAPDRRQGRDRLYPVLGCSCEFGSDPHVVSYRGEYCLSHPIGRKTPGKKSRVARRTRPIRLDPQSDDFRNLHTGLKLLIDELRKFQVQVSAPESATWTQRLYEIVAGKEYLKAPRARRDILDELLAKPLKRIVKEAPENMRKTARDFLNWYKQT